MKEPIYFSSYDKGPYQPKNTFYNSEEIFWTNKIEEKFPIIKSEIEALLKDRDTVLHSYFASKMVNKPNSWKTLGFYYWGFVDEKNCKKCPLTMALIDTIPGIVSASISIMTPQSEIKGHNGDTNAIYRCHFPIVIPASLPETGFQVETEQKSWIPGKFLIFNDAAYHKAWNKTDHERIILIIDIVKPEFKNKMIWICSKVHGALMAQYLAEKLNYFRKKSHLKNILKYVFAFIAWLYLNLYFTKLFKK